MIPKLKEKVKVRELRKIGLSYTEIEERIPVAKSSISLWCQDIKLTPEKQKALENKKIEGAARGREAINTMAEQINKRYPDAKNIRGLYLEKKHSVPEIAKILGLKEDFIYRLMKKYNIPRRNESEASYVFYKFKPQFKIKENLSIEEENLRIAGIMLYWAEGSKKTSGIDFANSDPDMIRVFLKFLRQICNIDENRSRVYLYVYSYQDIDKIKIYWHTLTGIPLKQFTSPYVRRGNSNLSERKLPYGLVHIRYYDKRLLEILIRWIKEYIETV